MDQKTKEYLDRSLVGLTAKEDLEKLRQEMKSSFRQLKEENKNQILEWQQEVKAAIERLREEGKININPIREEITQGLQKTEIQVQSALSRANEFVTSLLQRINEEVRADIDRSRQELGSTLRMIKDDSISDLRREMSADSNRVDGLREETRKVADEMTAFNQKIKEAFTELKDELGSMMRFSYADLEKRLTTLEARIKSLEKMVLP